MRKQVEGRVKPFRGEDQGNGGLLDSCQSRSGEEHREALACPTETFAQGKQIFRSFTFEPLNSQIDLKT